MEGSAPERGCLFSCDALAAASAHRRLLTAALVNHHRLLGLAARSSEHGRELDHGHGLLGHTPAATHTQCTLGSTTKQPNLVQHFQSMQD